MALIYLMLAGIGILFPYAALIPWLFQHGPDIQLVIDNIKVNKLSLFAWLDVLISGVTLLLFIVVDAKRHGVRYYLVAIAGLFFVGVSFALPLYLYLRERQLPIKY
ncbi:hypothetical protein PCIT_a0236 [Pseudoalteromonas citrea]|uniref:DUF2834 domain-containing protein n=2 Tax=Pseudoalteromonas citrea TaxID=43655 RepID=A0AAD4AKI8_9GAMM|nr:DUF2834 domain-containing protein [Pseudoalteromonas citrea]KAF7773895.1 hypothetical protein PCIT_a0236 [Pseudoalteromonas citrea]